VFLSVSCIPEDKFGLSTRKEIKEFEIPGQAGVSVINKDSLTVVIPVDFDYDQSSATPSKIVLSNMASSTPGEGETQDFSEGVVIYSVSAEDKSIAEWAVSLKIQQSEVQLPNSDFNLWYDAGGYPEPGDGITESVWGTANKALALVGGYNTEPVSDGNNGFYAKMTTIQAPAIVRIAAATLFTGSFKDGFPSIEDPRSNIDFGMPYTSVPTGFKVMYIYVPGDSYEDGDGNPLPGADACDIYVMLEVWEEQEGTTIKKRVATAWYRSSDIISSWTALNLTFTYGELPGSDPDYMKPADGYAPSGSKPTHITVVFSSSALGDFFTGAIGSILEVDDFELIY
jgi:hypothetical protein